MDTSLIYTWKSAYSWVQKQEHQLDSIFFFKVMIQVFPSQIVAFAWKMILDRTPSKNNLLKRKVLSAMNILFLLNVDNEFLQH